MQFRQAMRNKFPYLPSYPKVRDKKLATVSRDLVIGKYGKLWQWLKAIERRRCGGLSGVQQPFKLFYFLAKKFILLFHATTATAATAATATSIVFVKCPLFPSRARHLLLLRMSRSCLFVVLLVVLVADAEDHEDDENETPTN